MTRQLPRIFAWHVARHVWRHPLLALLNVLSVGLGVAVFLAIQVANHSASASFAASIDLVAGKAHLEARAPGGVDETLLPLLARQPGVRAATPLVEGFLTLPDFPGEYLQVLGLDPFTNPPFATFALEGADRRGLDVEAWLRDPDAVAVSEEWAQRTGRKLGDRLRVSADGQERFLTVRFLLRLEESAAGRGNSRVAAMDIAWAQELFGRVGKLSAIQLLLDDPLATDATAERLQKLVPADVQILAPGQRSGQVQRMLAGFQLNLTALSLVSLLVGMFLIHNTVAASVVRRRAEVGMLRALGATRGEVTLLFLGEALLLGALGVLAGIGGGMLLAGTLVGAVAKTVSSLYVLLSIDAWSLTPGILLAAVALGLGTVAIAAWFPAREGARLDPVRALSLGAAVERSVAPAGRWAWLALAGIALAAGCSALALSTGPALLGFVAAGFVVLGFAFWSPPLVRAISVLAGRLAVGRAIPRLAAQNLGRALSRNSVTVAALMAAVAMTTGTSAMIFAFRSTVETWIARTVIADLFLTPAANETAGFAAFTPLEVIEFARRLPQVARLDTFREFAITVRGERASLAAIDGQARDNLSFLGGDDRRKARTLFEPGTILVSEPFARRFNLWDGDTVPLPTPRGVIPYRIGGVYYDYSRDSGVILIARENFNRHWDDRRVQSVALYLKDPATQLEEAADALRAFAGQRGKFLVYSNRTLRERVFQIFDQTFRVTYVLRAIAVVVAVAGIFLGLTTLVAERGREIGVLRAVGASAGQIRGMILAESGLIGLAASVLGVIAGIALSVVLTVVINRAFFGWTIPLAFPWASLLATPLWIVPAALAAGWIPAARAARRPIAEAVRSE